MILKKCFPKIEFFKSTGSVKGWKVTSYDVELLHLIKKAGLKIEEVEVGWQNEDISTGKGSSLERYFKESKEMLLGEILDLIKPMREKRNMYAKDLDSVRKILNDGAKKAKTIATDKINIIRDKVGVKI